MYLCRPIFSAPLSQQKWPHTYYLPHQSWAWVIATLMQTVQLIAQTKPTIRTRCEMGASSQKPLLLGKQIISPWLSHLESSQQTSTWACISPLSLRVSIHSCSPPQTALHALRAPFMMSTRGPPPYWVKLHWHIRCILYESSSTSPPPLDDT